MLSEKFWNIEKTNEYYYEQCVWRKDILKMYKYI